MDGLSAFGLKTCEFTRIGSCASETLATDLAEKNATGVSAPAFGIGGAAMVFVLGDSRFMFPDGMCPALGVCGGRGPGPPDTALGCC